MPTESSLGTSLWLAIRSLVWTLLLPGVVAGYVPWRFFGLRPSLVDWDRPVRVLGLLGMLVGASLLAACIWEFARRGRGTLSPVDPPRTLVVQGLYRHVRNPMYVAVSVILLGEVLLTSSRGLLLYWAVFFLCVNVFVLGFEEPTLHRSFGAAYEEYCREVRRWVPRLQPFEPRPPRDLEQIDRREMPGSRLDEK